MAVYWDNTCQEKIAGQILCTTCVRKCLDSLTPKF